MSLSVDAESLSVPAPAPAAAGTDAQFYSYRLLSPAELPLLNELYNSHYRAERPLAEAEWLYARNPNGHALIYAAFDPAGQLAGMRPAVPYRLYWGGEARLAYEFADALVATRHQGRGIFSRLVRMICEQAGREDFTLYSLPNAHSLPVYRRSRLLQELGASETRVRPISWPAWLARRLGFAAPRAGTPAAGWEAGASSGGVTLVPISGFQSDFEDIHVELGRRVASFTQRDRAYLQWRYFGFPAREYRVALAKEGDRVRGYVAVRLVDRVAHLVDVFLAPQVTLACRVFEAATAWASAMGAVAVHFNASRGNLFHAAATRSGFRLAKRSGSLVLDRRSGAILESRQCGPLGPSDAYFVMGDFDFL